MNRMGIILCFLKHIQPHPSMSIYYSHSLVELVYHPSSSSELQLLSTGNLILLLPEYHNVQSLERNLHYSSGTDKVIRIYIHCQLNCVKQESWFRTGSKVLHGNKSYDITLKLCFTLLVGQLMTFLLISPRL